MYSRLLKNKSNFNKVKDIPSGCLLSLLHLSQHLRCRDHSRCDLDFRHPIHPPF